MVRFLYALSLGSNLGHRLHYLQSAICFLSKKVNIQAISSVYRTEPMYVLDQPEFFNIACIVATDLAPMDMLIYIKQIESLLGRRYSVRYGARQIDLDILLYRDHHGCDLIWNDEQLQLPHYLLHERAFVLYPLLEIAEDWIHPLLQQTVLQMSQHVDCSRIRIDMQNAIYYK